TNMNKKFFAAAAIAALMGAGGYFAKSSTTQNDGLSDLELANAEALAEKEGVIIVEFDVACLPDGEGCWLSLGRFWDDKKGVAPDGTIGD
ncbi:MAG: hypothetical protein K2M11_02100, partial [Paramuribaculum sp.]|nr:hypothetical protein [Paramuribaculum sp.]